MKCYADQTLKLFIAEHNIYAKPVLVSITFYKTITDPWNFVYISK
jgi:hypothetical protein